MSISAMKSMAADDVKETDAARNETKVGGDGTTGASGSQLDKMIYKSDPHAGVWGNEESYQFAMRHYTTFLSSHPVWSHKSIQKDYPVKINYGRETYSQKSWWPQGKTTRHQYCNCHEKKDSSRYKTPPLRRNNCPECGYLKSDKDNALDYEWDPIDDPKKGKPNLGDVVTMKHDMRGVQYDEEHKGYKELTERQKIVGKSLELGSHGYMSESYDKNMHTRQLDTAEPDGPAWERKMERENDLQKQMETKRKEEMENTIKVKSESQLRNEAANREKVKVEGMHEKFDWREGAPMPYGDRDKPELVVSGPARRRAEERKEIKMSLMNQPHNKTDRLAYCKGDVLKELHAEQKSGRVSKALKYYKMVSAGRGRNAMNEVIESDKKAAKESRDFEEKEFNLRKKKRVAATKLANLNKGVGGKGNTRNRMMARTTFGEKSLHSDKFVARKKQLESKFFLDGDALENDRIRDKKRRKKEKKRKKREEKEKVKREAKDADETPEGELTKKKKKAKKKEEKKKKLELQKMEQLAKLTKAMNLDLEGSDDDSLVGGFGVVSLQAQSKKFKEQIEGEEREKIEAQREALEKQEVNKGTAGVMQKDKFNKELTETAGKSKRKRQEFLNVKRNMTMLGPKVGGEDNSNSEGGMPTVVAAKSGGSGFFASLSSKFSSMTLGSKAPKGDLEAGLAEVDKEGSGDVEKQGKKKKKKKKGKKDDDEGSSEEMEGGGGDDGTITKTTIVVDKLPSEFGMQFGGSVTTGSIDDGSSFLGSLDATATITDEPQYQVVLNPVTGEERIARIDPETGQPMEEDVVLDEKSQNVEVVVKESLLFLILKYSYIIGGWAFWLIERPLLVLPHKYNPYKQYRARKVAQMLMRENTGASFLESEFGNDFRRSPLKFVVDVIMQFLNEKWARVQIFLFSFFMWFVRVWLRRNRVYTVEDLEGGAYDGDNVLVMKCFSQKLKKGDKPLNVNSRTPDGKTPLQCCFEGLLNADRKALEKSKQEEEKANEEDKDAGEKTKMVKSGLRGMMSGMKSIAKIAGVIQDPIQKYNKTLATLLSMGADVHLAQDPDHSQGYSLMHLAAQAGNCKRLVWLTTKLMKVDVLSLGQKKITPLHLAAAHGQCEAVMLLLTSGAPINTRDRNGRTPLHMAAETGGTHVTRVMMLCGANKNMWDDKGRTPFDYAVLAGRKSTTESLLVYRAPSMSAKQSINFLFHRMMADGEHKEKKLMTKTESVVDDVGDTARAGVRKGLGLLKWGANMVRTGVRITDGAARGENETTKMKAEREAREAKEGTGVVTVGRDLKKTWGKALSAVKAFRKSRVTVDLDAEVGAGFDLEGLAGEVQNEVAGDENV
ncbi:hypothetical protein TrLO_g7624 [Triparma laevis f. longispina]|uniref:Uncharacterized protein n=1 Tax=Triparma laevis f. longispina TaxID=1714387 RepID=A0A9W7FL14_9STRA|nr:hypothetical protein TrLO_g7624 [Triparma laevis f. longispina]